MKKLGITLKLTLIFILFAGAVLVGLGIPAYNNGRAALEAATVSELLTTAIEKQAALNNWVADRQNSIGDIANQAHLREAVKVLIAAAPGSSDAGRAHADLVADLKNWVGEGHRFLAMEVIDAATGRVIAATDAIEEGKFREEQPYFINGLQAAYVQNPYYNSRQGPSMTAAAPVLSPDGRVVAVLAGPLNMGEMDAIILRRSGLHQTDDTFLVNTSNLFVTQPRLITDPAVLQRGIHTEAIDRCLVHISGVVAAPDYRDVPAFIVYRWLPERQLCLITKIDQDEALAPARTLASTMALTGGLVFLIGSIVAFGLSRTITRPVRHLVQGAEQIGLGNLDHRIEAKSEDEIGKLGISFNEMAAAIGEKETQLRNWATDLERRVEERTSELRASEERYRILSETSPDMIFVIDRQDTVQYVNNLGARQFGKTPEQVIGKTRTELFPPGIAENQAPGLQQVLKSAQPLTSESSIAFPGGQLWLDTQLVPLRNDAGEVNAVMGVSRDITDRKHAEEAVRRSEEQYRELIEQAADGIFISDGSGKYVAVNSRGCAMLGYSLEELLGKNLNDLVPAEEKRQNAIRLDDLRAGKLIISERRLICKDGSLLPVEISGKMLADGRFQGIVRDITERKRSENALLQYSRRLAVINRLDQVISSSLDIGKVYDAFVVEMKELVEFDRTSIVMLDQACENWQIIRQWTRGKPAFKPTVWYPIKGTAFGWVVQHQKAYLEETLGEKTEWSEHEGLHKEGLQSRVLLPLILQGEVTGMLTLASRHPKAYQQSDLELLQTLADQMAIAVQNAKLYGEARLTAGELEERVMARTSQLEKANKDLESFSYSVSHDLRAPLRAINGFAQILVRRHKENLDGEGQHYLENVVEASTRMGVLIDDLLQYSRVGRASVHRQTVSLDDLFAHILGDLYPRIAETQAVVELPAAGVMPRIISDSTILGQIFTNIINNALTYHRSEVPPVIRVTYQAEADQHLFGVADNGIGIPAEYLEKIFNVFQRLHSTEEYPGTGIGLAIVKKSVDLLGGRVRADSTEGAGSTFWIQIPKE